MPSLVITLTDYHVSRTLGYIDASLSFPDAIGGTTTPPPIQVPLTAEIAAAEQVLTALIASALKAELLQRPGADPRIDVTPLQNATEKTP